MDDVLRKALDAMTDSFRRDVFKSHDRVNGYAKFQKHSYDYFMTTLLPHIIGEFSNPAIVHDSVSTGRRHVISFGNVTMGSPSHRESDGKVCSLLPEEARLRQLDYTLLVMIDAIHEVFPLDPDTPVPDVEDDDISPEWTMHLPNMEKRVVHREVPFFEIPVMVQSRFCALHGISRVPGRGWDGSGLKQPSSECPRDEGGYFIIRGLDRTLQMQESLRTNTPFVFPVKQPNKYGFVCEVRSRYETKMRSTSTLRINITTRKGGTPPSVVIVLPFLPTDVPLLAMFRMLGFNSTDDMVAFIHGPTPLPDVAAPHVHAVLRHTCEDLSDDEIFDNLGRAGTKEPTVEARRKYITHLLANEFLPHLGLQNTPVEMRKKAIYLGMMVRRLLIAYCDAPSGFKGGEVEGLGIKGVDDRDHYANKRLATAGTMIALLLRQHMRKFIKTMKRTLANLIENRRPLDVGNVVNTHKISADIRYAFRTGNWSVQRTNTSQNVGITQIVSRMSQLALKSQIGRINTPMNRDGKMTHPRQAHLSTWGILCPNETPEGVGCGLVKNLSVLVHVRVGSSKDTLEKCLFTFMDVRPITESSDTGYLVMVNGDIVGTHPNPDELAARTRCARRNHIIPYDTSVVRSSYGVSISIDAGCCMRPVFVADNLHLLEGAIADNRQTPTEELWTLLLRRGIIEYLDKEEEMEMRIAVTPAEMAEEMGIVDDPEPYTHVEISPSAMLGHCARQIPFADRNQAPRNIYQASMGKQAVAVPTLPYADRFDAQMHVPHYTQRPLVETGTEDAEFGMGINAVVAIMQHTGYNQEDSIIMNKSFVERGGFRSTYYTTHTAEEQCTGADPECFENPTMCEAEVTGIKQADYSALDDVGTIDLNARLTPGTVLVGKTISTQHVEGKTEKNVKRDASLVFNGADDASRVDKVMLTNNRDGVNCQRVRVRTTRIPIVGDKFSSRHGQKGTIGVLLPQVDMPFSLESGITPDIIINPCALPSRMTIAHLVECVASKTGVVLGKFVNGEPFRDMSVEHDLCDALHKAGFQRHGNERMVSGISGELMEASVFMGPTFYQRLRHMTADKVHSRATGPKTTVTRQPTEGRSNHGGLRLGEMERDCLVSHGGSRVLQERYLFASDAYSAPFCHKCGILAEHAHNEAFGAVVKGRMARCRVCGDTNVKDVTIPFAYKLLLQELGAMGVSVKHGFDKK
jgi:DNA-directed RNA polymerase II subunit RPB2